jgi:glycosyltransferase involved in cell wall biosynthesis
MTVKILLLRTRYPHWGAQSGINQVLKYIDWTRFSIDERIVEDSDEQFPIENKWVRRVLRWAVQRSGMQWYRLSDLAMEVKVFRRSLRGELDIVHYFDGEHSAQYFPGFQKRSSRLKVIATYHQPPERLDSVVIRKIIPRIDYVLVVSPDQVSYFNDLVGPERVRIILHGINTDFFRPGGKRRRDGKFRCLSVGHCQRDFKAIGKVAMALKNHRRIEFHVVTGHQTGLECYGNVTLHRGLNDSRLLACYQDSDILFLPMFQSTANNALLEGIACGLPVVSTQLPSVKTYLPGEEAILVEDNQVNVLAEAVLNLYKDPGRWEFMSGMARKRALELDWRNIAPEYESLYSEIAERL